MEMEYKILPELRNTYPTDPENVSQSYTSANDIIKYSGKYPDPDINNFITFDVVDYNDGAQLIVDPELTINFIVEFVDGDTIERYTSQKLKDDLQAAIEEPNPYFTRRTVTTAVVDLAKLKNYWASQKFDIPEKYAEACITDTITTIPDILKHINWIVSVLDVDDELREVDTFGSWTLYTEQTDLGFAYSDDIDDLDNGNIDGDIIVDKTLGDACAPEITDEPSDVDDNDDTDPGDTTGNTYVPFGAPGTFDGETRYLQIGLFTRLEFRWSASSMAWIRT
jgi:hypothetical protein